ncbi:MAG TPA: sigma-70 family RNA polymerase sigma factor [Kofleriaceae bacterium]|nr:sigma-70 family RNA polymerase sigma factor [Kofleriaceae bacterium]
MRQFFLPPIPAAASRAGPDDPDSDVLDLVARGKRAIALRHLMRRHGSSVFRYCVEALREATLAEDVHQQIFIQVNRDLPGFGGRSTVRTWLFAIARHRVLDAARARERTRARFESSDLDAIPDPRSVPGDRLDQLRLHRALAASLAELEEPVRTAVMLRYQQGFTYVEMAEICGERPGTLAARVTRALPLLRALVMSRLTDAPHLAP